MRLKSHFEYDIFVPTIDIKGKRYSKKKVAQIRTELVEHFGGLTDTRHKNVGMWKVGGVEIRDEIVIWRALSELGSKGDRFISKIKAKLEKLLQQNEILIIRRKVHRIT